MDGADGLVLSGETAVGSYVFEALDTMRRIAHQAEKNTNYLEYQVKMTRSVPKPISVSESIASSAVLAAHQVNASIIVCITELGGTARLVAKYRAQLPVVAATLVRQTARQMAATFGLVPYFHSGEPDNVIYETVRYAYELGLCKPGDIAVITSGQSIGFLEGTTTKMQLYPLVVSENSPTVNETFDQISYTIKTIFQSGKEAMFTEQLNQFISRKEGEIERMCNFHYQEFVQSVDQLLKVRLGTVHLKSKVVELNKEMQADGCKIIDKNVELAFEALQVCLFVLDVSNKVSTQIDNRKYYSALRLLEDLETVHLRHIAQYDFSVKMREFIPHQREQIRQAVCKEMTEWFVKVRENSRKLGKSALEAANNRKRELGDAIVTGHTVEGGGYSSRSLDIINSLNTEEFRVDFKPLYQCLHIHDVLGKRKMFKTDFEENRKLQAGIILNTQLNLQDGDLKDFETYISDIVGFFIIEAVVESLWDTITDKLNSVITIGLEDCQASNLYLSIKILVVAFIKTMESYGYPVNNLMTLMLSLFDRYTELMKFHCSEKILEIVEEDEYAPMIVESADEYEEIMKAFRLREDKRVNLRLPTFADGFSQQNNEMDDLLKKSLENLLIQSLGNAVTRVLGRSQVAEVVQILTNAEYFVLACGEFEQMLSEKRTSQKTKTSLHATTTFRELKGVIEKRIFDLVNQKIDEFLDVSCYDWVSTAPRTQPSQYILEIISYLTSTMSSTLSNLPTATKNFIYFNVLDYMALSIHGLLVSKSVKRITTTLFDHLDLDVNHIEGFVQGLGDIQMGDRFVEIKQIIALIKSENYEEFLSQPVRAKRYHRIHSSTLITIMEKIKASETSSFLTKLTNAEKAKRKSVDTLLKSLKAQEAGHK
ncbi:hypothetical protein HDU67_009312 [Dinochytrium kinnereticum]|nr:hypothetical protein HDU67_009312 [Dinochytrium kinnereticum]